MMIMGQRHHRSSLNQKTNHDDMSFIQTVHTRAQPKAADNTCAGGNAHGSSSAGYAEILAEK